MWILMNKETDKKKGLNLNSGDKKLLTLLGGAVAVFLCYLLLNSLYTKNSQLSEEYKKLELEVQDKTAKINQKPVLIKNLNTLNAEALGKASTYYGDTNQGDFIYLIDSLINNSGITLSKVDFKETTELEFPDEKVIETAKKPTNTSSSSSSTNASSNTKTSSSSSTSASSSDTNSSSNASDSSSANAKEEQEKRYANTNITQMTADITFKGSYTQIIQLLDMVDTNQKTIVSSELELSRGTEKTSTQDELEDPVQEGRIKLRFYQVRDVERYVAKPVSMIEKTPIPSARLRSPFMRPTWLATKPDTSSGEGTTNASDNTSNNLGTGLGSATSNHSPSYLQQLNNLSSNNGLSAYYNTSTIYNFESPLKLVQKGNQATTDVGVDTNDFLEGKGSNAFQIPATKTTTLFEMSFPEPYVTLNTQPNNISFNLSLSNDWKGKVGLVVRNSSGQKIYLHVIKPTNWSGWREVGFDPASIPGFTYPMTILGFYFETPSNDSPEATLKVDNLAVNNLITN